MVIPGVIAFFLFSYLPMFGIYISFTDYQPGKALFSGKFVGLKWFTMFLNNAMSFRILRNTFLLGLYSLLWGFPAPILLALLLNEISNVKFKRLVQTVTYLPHFVSSVIVVGMMMEICSRDGAVNQIRHLFGFSDIIQFLADPKYFRTIFISMGIWQGLGWGTIIYLAALTNVNVELYEAAVIDGANRLQRCWHITIPEILPTVSILLILSVGSILYSDSQKILLLYNPQIYETADVIGTYTYREGIQNARYAYTSAVGLFLSILSFIMVFGSNMVSKHVTRNSLW